MSEFADHYRVTHTYEQPECALWQDILYGSDKQYFWYADPYMRTCLDMNQGGAMIDLRPYVAKLERPVGIGTKYVQDASYPFLIQANYRAGYFTHYAGEGTIKSLKVSYQGEEVDLCLCRTKASYYEEGTKHIVKLDPVTIEFSDLEIDIVSTFVFEEGCSQIKVTREITRTTNENAQVEFNEYITACYGTTEYPEDMTNILLSVENSVEKEQVQYNYKCREAQLDGVKVVKAIVPEINTQVEMLPEGDAVQGYFREGYAFSPMFTLGLKKQIKAKGEMTTWLKLQKAN